MTTNMKQMWTQAYHQWRKIVNDYRFQQMKIPNVNIASAVFSVLLICYLTMFSPVKQGVLEDINMETIHVVLTLRGVEAITMAEVMLKSMLYYQGRFREDTNACTTTHFPQNHRVCEEALPLRRSLIVFHVLIDYASRPDFVKAFHQWHRPYLQWNFYRAEYHEDLLKRLHNTHHSGIPSLMKLLVPVILPHSVEKVIVMDSDMMFNHNILDLWYLFKEFNSSQAIGLSWTLKASLPGCQYFRYSPITDRGLNGGLSLMYLSRLRKIGWHDKWQIASAKFFERNVLLMQADQDIFNTVIELNPTIYFRVPCEWNVQLCSKTAPDCCPVVWPMKTPKESDCLTNPRRSSSQFHPNTARLVHFTGKDKALFLNETSPENITLDKTDERLTQVEMKARFGEVYRAFQAVPSYCFE